VASNTNVDSLVFRVSFDEDAFNVDPSDFTVLGSTASVQSVTPIASNVFDVFISGGNLASITATVSVSVAANRNITDRAGNLLATTTPSVNETYFVDNIAPIAASFRRAIPNVAITSKDAIRFVVTFNESVTNVDPSDFVLVGTTASMTVSGLGTTYNVTVSGGDLDNLVGTVGLDFALTQNIADLATNPFVTLEPAIDETFSIVQSTLDFGDAPDTSAGTGIGNYQTSLADNGPRHTIVSGLRLGRSVDEEPDGLISDDGPNIFPALDDEDSLNETQIGLQLTLGSTPKFRLQATNMTANPATLFGWIDANRNGVFDNSTERTSVSVPTGSSSEFFTLIFPTFSPAQRWSVFDLVPMLRRLMLLGQHLMVK
jgi:hypothetical protein